MLVCAMNPCRCGWYGHPSGRCKCTETEVKKYLSRLSGPLLDRIDLFVEVAALDFEELSQRERAETSAQVKERVDAARAVQSARRGPAGALCNARMEREELDRFCALDDSCQKLMQGALTGLVSPPAAMTGSCGWPAPSPIWTAARPSRPPILPKLCSTVPPPICSGEGRAAEMPRGRSARGALFFYPDRERGAPSACPSPAMDMTDTSKAVRSSVRPSRFLV